MSEPCQACADAQEDHTAGLYHASCDGCKARMVSHSPQFYEARKRGALGMEYLDLLFRVFGTGSFARHEEVKKWAELPNRPKE